jgi:hypothetical protein
MFFDVVNIRGVQAETASYYSVMSGCDWLEVY